MLDDEIAYIKSYSCAVDAFLNNRLCSADLDLFEDMPVPESLKDINPLLSGQIELYRNIAMVLVAESPKNEPFKNYLELHRTQKEPFKTPVVIIAGGASLMDKTEMETYRNYFRKMMHGFTGTIISGGTTAGIPGLVGEVKEALEKQQTLDFNLVGYLPGMLPTNAAKSKAYDIFCETDSDHFSVLEILSYWCDLVCSGIHPSGVVLVGINGGKIAAMEYRIALSLGAKVKILANSGRAANELLEDKYWKTHQNLSEVMPD
jgi:hypothetical protein